MGSRAATKPIHINYLAMGAISALPCHSALQYSLCSISCPELKFIFLFPDTGKKEKKKNNHNLLRISKIEIELHTRIITLSGNIKKKKGER